MVYHYTHSRCRVFTGTEAHLYSAIVYYICKSAHMYHGEKFCYNPITDCDILSIETQSIFFDLLSVTVINRAAKFESQFTETCSNLLYCN